MLSDFKDLKFKNLLIKLRISVVKVNPTYF